MDKQENYPILKDLNAVVTYATEHFSNEFLWQEFRLKESFKNAFANYLTKKNGKVLYFSTTSVITTRKNQQIFVANQWFAIASYYVDFRTELITYQQYFENICNRLGICDKNTMLQYATKMKSCSSQIDRQRFFDVAFEIISAEFPNHPDCEKSGKLSVEIYY